MPPPGTCLLKDLTATYVRVVDGDSYYQVNVVVELDPMKHRLGVINSSWRGRLPEGDQGILSSPTQIYWNATDKAFSLDSSDDQLAEAPYIKATGEPTYDLEEAPYLLWEVKFKKDWGPLDLPKSLPEEYR